MIRARNDEVLANLAHVDNLIIPGQALQAFCASSKLWWYHREKTTPLSEQWLELSGIIRLRQHCLGLVSRSQSRLAKLFLEHTLPTLLADVGSWVSTGAGSSSAEQRMRLCEILKRFEQRLRTVCAQAGCGLPCGVCQY